MAHLKPHLLSDWELRRFKDSADENTKLADCWNGAHAVILSLDWSDAYKIAPGCTILPSMRLDIMTPSEQPGWEGGKTQQVTTRQHSRRSIKMLQEVKITKANRRFAQRPFYMQVDAHETFELYSDDAKKKAQDIFDELAADYAAMCIVNYDVRDAQHTMRALETFGVRLPSKAVFVDLVKVLEHQTRDEGIPERLRPYTDENVAARHGRYDRRPGTLGGYLGMPYVRLLEVLGPAAESHRRRFEKAEKQDVAIRRIARRIHYS